MGNSHHICSLFQNFLGIGCRLNGSSSDETDSTSGSIHFKGQDLQDLTLVDYRKEVSYFFQQAVLFGETVEDNLVFPFTIRNLPFDREKAMADLAKVNLPADYLTKKVRELSGGEKQRVAVIRNLMFDPKVLLLDEITAGLDVETKSLVRQLISHYHQSGKTIIDITHDKEDIEQAHKIFSIVGGRPAHDNNR